MIAVHKPGLAENQYATPPIVRLRIWFGAVVFGSPWS
jgi:hypothetical protein